MDPGIIELIATAGAGVGRRNRIVLPLYPI